MDPLRVVPAVSLVWVGRPIVLTAAFPGARENIAYLKEKFRMWNSPTGCATTSAHVNLHWIGLPMTRGREWVKLLPRLTIESHAMTFQLWEHEIGCGHESYGNKSNNLRSQFALRSRASSLKAEGFIFLHWMMSFRCFSLESSMVYSVCLVMLLRSTFLQSSSIWNVMSALWITVLEAYNPIKNTN